MSNGTFNIDAELADLQTELDEAKNFVRWNPPAGSYDCLLDKVVQATQEKDGTIFPVYKPFFKILEAGDLDGDSFSRWFGFTPGKGRKFQLVEMMALARAINHGEEVGTIKDAVDILIAASDDQDVVVGVTVSYRQYGTPDEEGNLKTACNFAYKAVAVAVA